MADARTQLVKLVEEVKTLQQKFQGKKKVVDELKNLEAQLQAVIKLFPSDGVPEQTVSPQDSPAGRGEEAAPESDTMQLADFFENVSQSLIDAQTTLNDRSLDYARNPIARYSTSVLLHSELESGNEGWLQPNQRQGSQPHFCLAKRASVRSMARAQSASNWPAFPI